MKNIEDLIPVNENMYLDKLERMVHPVQ